MTPTTTNRREFLQFVGAGLTALALPVTSASAAPGDAPVAAVQAQAAEHLPAAIGKPNIVFIYTDDVGLGNISCYGADNFKTPNIDALASTGTRFEYCYATPLCGPSRCQTLTGRYPFRTGLNGNHVPNAIAPDKEVMIPTVLKAAGYVTAQVGKWGQMSLGPAEWGFDEYLVYRGSGRYWRDQTSTYVQNGETRDLPEDVYLPDLMHDFLVDFMTRHKDRPFFIYYPMSHMHGPIVPTPDSKPGGDRYTENNDYMDKLVDKLVDDLDRLNLRERTVIVFTGDNGTAMAAATKATVDGRRLSGQKGSMLEGGSRVPLIVNWPGVTPAGAVNHDLTDFSDFMPTFAELAGAALPQDRIIDGQSFASQIKGQAGHPRTWVYVELNGKSYVRDTRWKLTNTGEMFDLTNAPFEEIPVPNDTTDAGAIAARRSLQQILDQHPAAAAGKEPDNSNATPRKKKKKADPTAEQND